MVCCCCCGCVEPMVTRSFKSNILPARNSKWPAANEVVSNIPNDSAKRFEPLAVRMARAEDSEWGKYRTVACTVPLVVAVCHVAPVGRRRRV